MAWVQNAWSTYRWIFSVNTCTVFYQQWESTDVKGLLCTLIYSILNRWLEYSWSFLSMGGLERILPSHMKGQLRFLGGKSFSKFLPARVSNPLTPTLLKGQLSFLWLSDFFLIFISLLQLYSSMQFLQNPRHTNNKLIMINLKKYTFCYWYYNFYYSFLYYSLYFLLFF